MNHKTKPGDKIIIADLDGSMPIREYTVIKVTKDTFHCEGEGNVFFKSFCFPARARDRLVKIIAERARLKKAYDDSFKLVCELTNELAREEKITL